jgi:hypothetical protein
VADITKPALMTRSGPKLGCPRSTRENCTKSEYRNLNWHVDVGSEEALLACGHLA